MRASYFVAFLWIWLFMSLNGLGPAIAADDKEQINAFYKKFVDMLRLGKTGAEKLGEIVGEDPKLAEKCLAMITEKSKTGNKSTEFYRFLSEKLEDLLLLATKEAKCTGEFEGKLLAAADRQIDDDDRVVYLKKLGELCPKTGDAFGQLGDLYLSQGHFEMAVESYQRCLELKDDEESKTLMNRAQELLDKYQKIQPRSEDGSRELIKAAYYCKFGAVQLLLQQGTDLNSRNDFGETALMMAANNGCLKVVKLLVKNGADVNARDRHGYTALTWASATRNTEVIELLKSRDSAGTEVPRGDELGVPKGAHEWARKTPRMGSSEYIRLKPRRFNFDRLLQFYY